MIAILQTDVYGYGRVISRDEEETVRRVTGDLKMFEEVCARYHGQVLAHRGDGLKMSFDSPVQAMQAAVKMQQTIRERNLDRDNVKVIRHRMGLHFGDCIKLDGNVTGHAVAVAARLEQSAVPGQIAYSDQVHQLVRAGIDVPSRYVGWEEMKNLKDPVKVWMTRLLDDLATESIPTVPVALPPPPSSALPRGSGTTFLTGFMTAFAVLAAAAAGYWAYTVYQSTVQPIQEGKRPPAAVLEPPRPQPRRAIDDRVRPAPNIPTPIGERETEKSTVAEPGMPDLRPEPAPVVQNDDAVIRICRDSGLLPGAKCKDLTDWPKRDAPTQRCSGRHEGVTDQAESGPDSEETRANGAGL